MLRWREEHNARALIRLFDSKLFSGKIIMVIFRWFSKQASWRTWKIFATLSYQKLWSAYRQRFATTCPRYVGYTITDRNFPPVFLVWTSSLQYISRSDRVSSPSTAADGHVGRPAQRSFVVHTANLGMVQAVRRRQAAPKGWQGRRRNGQVARSDQG